ncbi:MAG: DUF1836 domain-containing protein [Lachnospiraceae bacterium]|nr:DUF1836 domain-containing protein [Lachnospiraceae bacterium]
MNAETERFITFPVRDFRLPSYEEIPDVGLYLEQTTSYINSYLAGMPGMELTGSMVSNYVKKGLIPKSVRKQYDRDQIAYLFFIAIAKSVLSMDNIQLFIARQKASYLAPVAYDYFCQELNNVLEYVYGKKNAMEKLGTTSSQEKMMLRNTVITIAHKIFLEQYFDAIRHNSIK